MNDNARRVRENTPAPEVISDEVRVMVYDLMEERPKFSLSMEAVEIAVSLLCVRKERDRMEAVANRTPFENDYLRRLEATCKRLAFMMEHVHKALDSTEY
jgi:hypothetical protein